MRLIDPIIQELEAEAKTTARLLDRVPEGQLAWKPHAKSMSLGQLALHVASIPAFVAGLGAEDQFELGSITQAPAKSLAEIVDTHRQGVQKAKEILGRVDDARATAAWTLTKGGKTLMTVPRIALYRTILLNHWIHHRGQLSVYLRLLDVPLPSIYGPSADENPFA